MKKILYIILMFYALSLYSQNKWELTHYKKFEWISDIEVIDSNNCFILNDNEETFIYKTSDQGKNWTIWNSIPIKDKSLWRYFDMSCPDTNNIYLGAVKGVILKISDSGKKLDTIRIDSNDLYNIENLTMLNNEVGIALGFPNLLLTKDGWKSYEKYNFFNDSLIIAFEKSQFVNDSIVKGLLVNFLPIYSEYFFEFNINTKELKTYLISKRQNHDLISHCFVNENLIFTCGESDLLPIGGSSNDAIYKSTDAGKTWRRVLDLYSEDSKFDRTDDEPPSFGIQSISFKDSLTGIAVGQFGKILYTYDGGESWIYENKVHDSIDENSTLKVKYVGSVPIITGYETFYRMTEDNLAPKAADIYSISGRVLFNGKGQPDIPVALGYRVTMTDADGSYKFTKLPKGNYKVKVLNKYYENKKSSQYYKPFDYSPEEYIIDLSRDTTGFDFNGLDLRTYYTVSGYVRDKKGQGISGINVFMDDSISKTDESGYFYFPEVVSKMQQIRPMSDFYSFSPWSYQYRIISDTNSLIFIADLTTDVEESTSPAQEGVLIYPNPATDNITINLSDINPTLKRGVEGNALIEIYDVMGILLHYTNLTPALSEGEGVRIDISNLAPGVYFVKIAGSNGACSIVEKFVKY